MRRVLLLLVAVVAVSGCYTATIETGRTPSNRVIKQAFASCWIYGLVPPKTVETASECPNGIARVMTRHSFVNQLVGMLTFGIYTPMEITVTCAEAGGTSSLEPNAEVIVCTTGTNDEIQKAFARAADRAAESGNPVYVQFEREELAPKSEAIPVAN